MDDSFYPSFSRILDFAQKHYREPIGIKELAAAAGYSPRRCNLLFRACYGDTMGQYLRTLRMDAAVSLLDAGVTVEGTARELSYTSRGFRKTFRAHYGVSPAEYLAGKPLNRPYALRFEYAPTEQNWGDGANPTPDGLWEYGYYDPQSGAYSLMRWNERERNFQAPHLPYPEGYNDPLWYTRNRSRGYGMHPGRATQAVKTFICPCSGTVEFLVFIGRLQKLRPLHTPCFAQLYHNDVPLTEPLVLFDVDPHRLFAVCTVSAGDRLRLHVDGMGNHKRDGVWLYRTQIAYRSVSPGSSLSLSLSLSTRAAEQP